MEKVMLSRLENIRKKDRFLLKKKYFKHFSGHLYLILVAKGSFMHVPLSVNSPSLSRFRPLSKQRGFLQYKCCNLNT